MKDVKSVGDPCDSQNEKTQTTLNMNPLSSQLWIYYGDMDTFKTERVLLFGPIALYNTCTRHEQHDDPNHMGNICDLLKCLCYQNI